MAIRNGLGLGWISGTELEQGRLEIMQVETQLEILEMKLLALRGENGGPGTT